MPADFGRTTALLDGEGRRAPMALLAAGLGLLALWAAWLCSAELCVKVKTVRARIEVTSLVHPVHVELGGRVRAARLDLDQPVRRGDVLAELEREGPDLELQEAEARLAANAAVLRQMEQLAEAERAVSVQLEAAGKVAIDETSARAGRAAVAARFFTRNAERWAALSEQGLAAEMDALKNQADAEAQKSLAGAEDLASKRVAADQVSVVKERRVKVELLQVEIAKRQVEMATDEVLIRRLRADLEKRIVRAPVDGRLGWVESLSSGMMVAPGQRIATIVPSGELRIVADLPAREAAGRVRAGQRATMMLEAYPWTQYGEIAGRVTRVGAEPNQGNLRVEVEIDAVQSGAAPRAHGLEGTLAIAVERTTPLTLLLRSVGRTLVSDPARPAVPTPATATERAGS